MNVDQYVFNKYRYLSTHATAQFFLLKKKHSVCWKCDMLYCKFLSPLGGHFS